jgi:hypothetical protein
MSGENRYSAWWRPVGFVKKADFIRFDSSRAEYHLVLGFRLHVRCRLVVFGEWQTDEAFAWLLHFIILLHWKTGLFINARVLGHLSLQWSRN